MYSEIVPHDVTRRRPREAAPRRVDPLGGAGIGLRGGRRPRVDTGLFEMGVPVLGICYGHQLMAQALGGEVAATGQREYGGTTLSVDQPGGVLLADFAAEEQVWMSHGDAVTRAPEGFRVTARTEQIPIAAMEDPERALFAVQFHPEVSHTPRGQDVLKRFLYEGCGLLPDWTPINIVEDAVARIRRAGRRRRGPVRALRRGRLLGRRAPRASRRRRPAHLRLRRSRAEPGGGAAAGRGDVRPPLRRAARPREGRRTGSSRSSRASPTPSASVARSGRSSSASSRRSRASTGTPDSSCRERCTPT